MGGHDTFPSLRLYHYALATRTEGPGIRAGVWVQGCPNHCVGCAAPETWDFSAGFSKDIDELSEEILTVEGLEGVTLAGGEPFCQAEGLAILAKRMQSVGKSVITFSGFTWKQLKMQKSASIEALLKYTDVLIDGPYIEKLASSNRYMVGSTNQQYHFLTERYKNCQQAWESGKHPNKLEIKIFPDGTLLANGMMLGKEIRKILDIHVH